MSLFGFDASSFNSVPHPIVAITEEITSHGDESVTSASRFGQVQALVNPAMVPPTWIEVQRINRYSMEDEEDSTGGITIVSSVPSSEVPVMLSSSPMQHGGVFEDTYSTDFSASMLSTIRSTTYSHVDIPTFSSLGQRSMLSMNPSSLNSSIMSNMTLMSSASCAMSSLQGPLEDEIASMSTIPFSQALVELSTPRQRRWFERFQCEEDWDVFYKDTVELLAAMEENDGTQIACPDFLLSQLIEQEERLFWNGMDGDTLTNGVDAGIFRRLQKRGLMLLGETLLIAATAAAFGSADTHALVHRVY
jgi:hypothetical protein